MTGLCVFSPQGGQLVHGQCGGHCGLCHPSLESGLQLELHPQDVSTCDLNVLCFANSLIYRDCEACIGDMEYMTKWN